MGDNIVLRLINTISSYVLLKIYDNNILKEILFVGVETLSLILLLLK